MDRATHAPPSRPNSPPVRWGGRWSHHERWTTCRRAGSSWPRVDGEPDDAASDDRTRHRDPACRRVAGGRHRGSVLDGQHLHRQRLDPPDGGGGDRGRGPVPAVAAAAHPDADRDRPVAAGRRRMGVVVVATVVGTRMAGPAGSTHRRPATGQPGDRDPGRAHPDPQRPDADHRRRHLRGDARDHGVDGTTVRHDRAAGRHGVVERAVVGPGARARRAGAVAGTAGAVRDRPGGGVRSLDRNPRPTAPPAPHRRVGRGGRGRGRHPAGHVPARPRQRCPGGPAWPGHRARGVAADGGRRRRTPPARTPADDANPDRRTGLPAHCGSGDLRRQHLAHRQRHRPDLDPPVPGRGPQQRHPNSHRAGGAGRRVGCDHPDPAGQLPAHRQPAHARGRVGRRRVVALQQCRRLRHDGLHHQPGRSRATGRRLQLRGESSPRPPSPTWCWSGQPRTTSNS